MKCSVIIVTYNSERYLLKALEALSNQTLKPDEVILVDSGSLDRNYLNQLNTDLNIKIIFGGQDIGFCKGNNVGLKHVNPKSSYLFFLNPDAFPFSNFIEDAIDYMENHKKCGAVTGVTIGYDIARNQPKQMYDSTGIFQSWYGKWYDRAQGKLLDPKTYNTVEKIPAICGAVFFARRQAINEVMLNDCEIFDESFYMYKEDIDLSLRLQKKGWNLIFQPKLQAYHCRGWTDRKSISKKFRLCSAKNEWNIHWNQKHLPGILYSSMKYLMVRFLNV